MAYSRKITRNFYPHVDIERGSDDLSRNAFRLRLLISGDFDIPQKDLIVAAALAFADRIDWPGLNRFLSTAGSLTDPRDLAEPFWDAWRREWFYNQPFTTYAGLIHCVMSRYDDGWIPKQFRTIEIYSYDEAPVDSKVSVGEALPHYYHITQGGLQIGLNEKVLNSVLVDGANGPDFWAGVIAHEILHCMGWRHPNGQSGTEIDGVQQYFEGRTSFDPSFRLNCLCGRIG